MRFLSLAGVLGLSAACRPLIPADEDFNDALVTTYRYFDAKDKDLAPVLRNLEVQLYEKFKIESPNVPDRGIGPSPLSADDVATLKDAPDLDPANALPVALVALSDFDVSQHARLPLLVDQREVEPGSPHFYERTWLSEKDCWPRRACAELHTYQDLTKEYPANILPSVTYAFYKDYRWVDLSADLEGASPRWAFIARAWNPGSYFSDNWQQDGENMDVSKKGLAIWQSYTLEMWIPRDGGGFTWADNGGVPEDRPDAADSTGEGTLRLLSLWSQQTAPIKSTDVAEAALIRNGMSDNFRAQDRWLKDHAP